MLLFLSPARTFARVLALVAVLGPLLFLALFGAPDAQAQGADAGTRTDAGFTGPSLIPGEAGAGATDGGGAPMAIGDGGGGDGGGAEADASILNQQAAGPTINIPQYEAE